MQGQDFRDLKVRQCSRIRRTQHSEARRNQRLDLVGVASLRLPYTVIPRIPRGLRRLPKSSRLRKSLVAAPLRYGPSEPV